MPSTDDARALGADIVRRWKAELFSADTVVALAAVVVAVPAGLLAGSVVGPGGTYAVWTASAVGPALGSWRGERFAVQSRTAALVGVATALGIAVVATGVVALAGGLGATDAIAVGAGAVTGLLVGGLAERATVQRFDERSES